MPGLAGLPGFLWRKLGRGGRIAVALLAAAGLVAVITSIPDLSERRRGNAERERQEEARSRRERLQADRALVAPRRARGIRSVAALEAAIAADVGRRERRRPLRVDCRRLQSGQPKLSCVAVTSEAGPSGGNRGVALGFPYRAVLNTRSGRAAFCRALGQPGEGAYDRGVTVELPAACGG